MSLRRALLIVSAVATVSGDSACPALNEYGIQHFDIALPRDLGVPNKQTFYVCQQFKIPENLLEKSYHVVGFTSLIDNEQLMHHLILFACTSDTPASKPHNCGHEENTCRSFLTVWSLGFDNNTCLYPKAGITIGKDGHQILSIQIHWNNEGERSDQTDSSGIRIYYTEKKRKYELGNVQIGQNDIEIAPGSMKLEHHGSCSPYCTSTRFTHPFYLTRTFIHMHSLGAAGRMDHYRNGSYLRNIAYDQTYSYKQPPVHYHPRAIKILPGDEIKLTCWFTTSGGERERNRTIYWGEGVEGEMCYAFVSYFPKAEGFDQCVQYFTYDQCDNYNRQSLIMGECNFRRFLSDMAGTIGLVGQVCDERTIPECDSKCAQSIRRIYGHPCMQGRLAVFLQRRVAWTVNWNRIRNTHEKLTKSCSIDEK